MTDVETDHRDGRTAAEHDVGSLGIHPDVELRGGRDVAGYRHRAPHDDQRGHCRGHVGFGFDGRGDIGQRADGDDGDLPGCLEHRAAEELHSGAPGCSGLLDRRHDLWHCGALRQPGSLESATARVAGQHCAGVHGKIGTADQCQQVMGVGPGL